MSRDGDELASTSMIFSICMFLFFFLQWKKNLVLPEFGLSLQVLSLVVVLQQSLSQI